MSVELEFLCRINQSIFILSANILEYYRVYKVIIPDNDSTLAHVDRSKMINPPRGFQEAKYK